MGLGLCLRWAGVFKRNLLSREGQVGGALRAQHAFPYLAHFSLNSFLVKGQCNLYFA